jgi:hypothetical protein
MTSTRTLLSAAVLLLTTACEPPTPSLAKLTSPVITAQRRLGGPLQVILTYDTARTPCGSVPNLVATLDGNPVNASSGAWVPEAMNASDRCQFPGFLITPEVRSAERVITFGDGATSFVMAINTLNLGSAVPDSPPATFHPGNVLRWLGSPPNEGTATWKVAYTPSGGAETSWGEGTAMPSSLMVTVPAVTAASSGIVALSWVVNTQVSRCEGLESCSVVVQGNAPLNAVVVP